LSVTAPPRSTDTQDDRELEQRVADLEALIGEARRRARRRRRFFGAAVLAAGAAVAAALIGFGGHGGGGAGNAAHAHGSPASSANGESPPLGALPADAGLAKAIAFDPRNPEIVYILTTGYPRSHVFKTTDGGAHWQATATSGSDWIGANEALAADPRHPGTLYAGTQLAIYKTIDGGKNWQPSMRGLFPPPRPTDRAKGWFVALAVDPANTKIVYAGSDRVSKSTDSGRSWKTVFPPHAGRHPRESVSALSIAPTRPEAIYAITGAFANQSSTPAYGRTTIYRSTDGGKTWHATTVVRGSVAPTALAVDPRHPTTVYAAVSARVLKTTNAGKTWRPIEAGLPISHNRGACHCLSLGGVRALAVDPRRTGTVYAALTQGGIYKITNGGQTWTRTLDTPLFLISTAAVDPARPTTIYASGQGETGDRPRILRSTDGGHTWAWAPRATP
jgi:photosystem II stability/assembly factor-like uncharacterized protein